MKALFFIIAHLHSTFLFTQEFPDFFIKGATWYYDAIKAEFTPKPLQNPVLILSYNKDTIIEGLIAVIIEEHAITNEGIEWNTVPQYWIMRQEENRIYQWTEQGFQLLYDFGLAAGSSFQTSPDGLYGFSKETSIEIRVDSSSVFLDLGTELPQYWTTCSLPYYSGLNQFRIGNENYLPIPYPLMAEEFYEPTRLRCYEDSTTLIKFVDYPCDATLITSTHWNPNAIKQLTIYPNPSSDFIEISIPLSADFTLTIFDATGKPVSHFKQLDYTGKFNIRDLPNGLYYVSLRLEQSIISSRFVKVSK